MPAFQLIGYPVKILFGPRHEDQIVAIGCQQFRQFISDAAGGAGHKCILISLVHKAFF
jgi:hypothetical protein